MGEASLKILTGIIDVIPDAIIIIDLNHKIIGWNKMMQEISNVNQEEMLGRYTSASANTFYGNPGIILADVIIKPEWEAKFNYAIQRDGEDLYTEGNIRVASLNKEVYYWAKASPIYDDKGKLIGAIEVLRDNSSLVELSCSAQAANEQAEAAFQQLMAAEEELRQQYGTLQETERELRKQLNFNQTMLDNMNELFYTFDLDTRLTFINKKSFEVLGYHPEELIGTFRTADIFPDEDWDWIKQEVARRLITGESSTYILPVRHKSGAKKYLKINSAPLKEEDKVVGAMVLADDVTDYLKAHEALLESERNFRRINDNMLDLVSELDIKGNLLYASPSHYRVLGYSNEVMMNLSFLDFVHPEDMSKMLQALKSALVSGKPATSQHRCRHANGHYIWTETLGNPIIKEGKVTGIIISSRDITERKRLEAELKHANIHDLLTNLYNRVYFEEEMNRLDAAGITPIVLMLFDVDGLKLVNDTLGDEAGDRLLIKTAEILQEVFAPHVVARVGGDEFGVLLPQMSWLQAEEASVLVQKKIKEFNAINKELPLSLSTGIAIREEGNISLKTIIKEANSYMNLLKLHRKTSVRSTIVHTLLKALEARDFITEGHGDRMQDLAVLLGKELGLDEGNLTILRLLAQFHDIGKVGVPDRILFKEGKLTEEEYQEMQRHAEIGYHIAMASPEFNDLPDLILKHHEWWNGEGYPLGLKGEEIPLECRILAIVDAYDAMTNDRPYRKAMTEAEAKAELVRCSGTQFDPNLVEIFLKIIG